MYGICGLLFVSLGACRDIVFPPAAPLQAPLQDYHSPAKSKVLHGDRNLTDEELLEGASNVGGLTTFANLPHAFCLSPAGPTIAYDIAFLGAPFDTVSKRQIYLDRSPLNVAYRL